MTGDQLARSYMAKAGVRRRVLEVLMEEAAYSDVDVIPTESYGPADGVRAQTDALAVYEAVAELLADRPSGPKA